MAVVTRRYKTDKEAVRAADRGGGKASPFRNLKPDETIRIRFLQSFGEVVEADQHYWNNAFEWCQGDDCEPCDRGDRPSTRYILNALELSDKGQVIALQMPKTVWDQFKVRQKKYGTITDRDYEITREGSGKNDTTYSVDPDAPSKKDIRRYRDKLLDIEALLNAEDGEEEEEEPRSTKKRRPGSNLAAAKRRPRDDEEEDEEDYNDEDPEEEEDDDERPKRRVSSGSRKNSGRNLRSGSRSRYQDDDEDDEDEEEAEDDYEDEDDVEDERPRRRVVVTKAKRGGLNEFKKKTATVTRRR